MAIIAKIPHEIEQIFGPAATDKFVDFLNSTYLLQREDVVALVSDRFEKNLAQAIGAVRVEIADLRTGLAELGAEVRTEVAEVRTEVAGLRTEIADLRSEVRTEFAEVRTEIAHLRMETKTDIAELRAEMKADFAGVQKEITGLHKEITGIHREISVQTRWMLATAVGLVTLYPVVTRLVARLIP